VIAHGKEEADAAARQERQVQEAPLGTGPLSAREREILDARARGLSTKQIAGALRIDDSTVRHSLRQIREKLRL